MLILPFCALLWCSCTGTQADALIDLQDSFFWQEADETSTAESALQQLPQFKKFDIKSPSNIKRLVGTGGHYIWLAAEFTIPPSLRGKDLGLFIDYLHFADKVWINGSFAGGYGEFPPDERSSLFVCHSYAFPKELLQQNDVNTVLIKVWAHGRSDISDIAFIGEYNDIMRISDIRTFTRSRIYMMFEGCMFSAFVLFLLLYIGRKKEKSNIMFSLMNLFTLVFFMPFFAPDLPWYKHFGIPYLDFIKFTLCTGMYFIVFFVAHFIVNFLHRTLPKTEKIIMLALLAVQFAVTVFAPDYDALIWLCPYLLFSLFVQLGFGIKELVRALLAPESRKTGLILLSGFSPFLAGMCVDIVVRGFMQNTNYPYFSIFAWQTAIIAFLVLLAIRYTRVYVRNEYLNHHLKQEVELKTKNLSETNERLEHEMERSNIDLEMASIVQQKFFPYPSTAFKGWDVAICYNPVAKVSGDLYDYYYEHETLTGFALFDVSGHGIAASLITMLAKNIIYRAFQSGKNRSKLSTVLYKINNEIIKEKGDIENYLTGLLFKFSSFDKNDACTVSMSNAGHPKPFFYDAETNEVRELTHDSSQSQYGAIGIKDIDVAFPDIQFEMADQDILVFFTDGLTESVNKEHEQFGKERAMQIIKDSAPKDAQSILEDLIDGLYAFTDGVPRDDDLTIIVLKRENSFNYIEELLLE